jgi:quinol monooxygenase YgiN
MIQRDETRVVVIAKFLAREGKEHELLERMHKLMEPTHKEPGYIRYELNQNVENPRIITYVEKFKDQQAFQAHKNAPYIVNFFQDIAPKLVENQEVTFHREVLP